MSAINAPARASASACRNQYAILIGRHDLLGPAATGSHHRYTGGHRLNSCNGETLRTGTQHKNIQVSQIVRGVIHVTKKCTRSSRPRLARWIFSSASKLPLPSPAMTRHGFCVAGSHPGKCGQQRSIILGRTNIAECPDKHCGLRQHQLLLQAARPLACHSVSFRYRCRLLPCGSPEVGNAMPAWSPAHETPQRLFVSQTAATHTWRPRNRSPAATSTVPCNVAITGFPASSPARPQ